MFDIVFIIIGLLSSCICAFNYLILSLLVDDNINLLVFLLILCGIFYIVIGFSINKNEIIRPSIILSGIMLVLTIFMFWNMLDKLIKLRICGFGVIVLLIISYVMTHLVNDRIDNYY